MEIGIATHLKKINRSLILSKIIKHGTISKSELATITNLTKATISARVEDLLDQELIIESYPECKSIGRKPIMVSLRIVNY